MDRPRSSETGGLLRDRGLPVRRLVLVDDALGRGLVQLLGRRRGELLGTIGVSGLNGLTEAAHGGLQRRLHGLVALMRSLVLPVPLDLGLDVRHWASLVRVYLLWVGAGAPQGAST